MTDHTLSDFGPQKLFNSAMEEIIFGSGEYRMAYTDPNNAAKICHAWNRYSLDRGWGSFIEAIHEGTKITIRLSRQGHDMLIDHNITERMRMLAGMRSDSKEDLVVRIVKLVKENGI
jgi:hypothetical protein